MVKSMTGFASAKVDYEQVRFTVEIRSVNHRYLDLSLRMPKQLSFLEGKIRSLLKEYAHRGKIDLSIQMEDHGLEAVGLNYNESLAREYVQYLNQIAETFSLPNNLTASMVASFPEVLTSAEKSVDEETIWQLLQSPLVQALGQFVVSRELEGKHLKEDILQKLSNMETVVEKVKERSPQIVEAYQQKLRLKMDELLADTSIEESRIAAEVVVFADKICNDEETVRLSSHIQAMKKLFLEDEEEGIGRKLDFLAQEMNREANTILSKSVDITVSNYAIELKTEIEKIREQVQNIE